MAGSSRSDRGRPKINDGFEPATAENIPEVLFSTFLEYYTLNPLLSSVEIRGSKDVRSMRLQYAAEAVGYVQIKRQGSLCSVKSRVTPEHRVHSPAYSVMAVIEESPEGNIIKQCQCLDCAASQGGCKHALALLAWLLYRTSEPSRTSVECYWKTSALSSAVKHGEVIRAGEIGATRRPTLQKSADYFLEFYSGTEASGGTLMMMKDPSVCLLLMHEASVDFRMNVSYTDKSAENFIRHMQSTITPAQCNDAKKATWEQANCPDWFEIRYGRISASRIHDVTRYQTDYRSLVETILGAYSVIETDAMKRGRRLEAEVIKTVAARLELKYRKCGIFIQPKFPVFGASPDPITSSHVIEVKCPAKDTTVKNYLTADGKPTSKYFAQVQLQMFLANRTKGFFCVASPDFSDISRDVNMVEVDLDVPFCENLMDQALNFWKAAIFPKLMKPSEKLVIP